MDQRITVVIAFLLVFYWYKKRPDQKNLQIVVALFLIYWFYYEHQRQSRLQMIKKRLMKIGAYFLDQLTPAQQKETFENIDDTMPDKTTYALPPSIKGDVADSMVSYGSGSLAQRVVVAEDKAIEQAQAKRQLMMQQGLIPIPQPAEEDIED